MNDPRQLELFTDGARAVAAARRPKPPRPTEADLQARLDAARQRLHEIVILRMKTWIREETRRGLREAEDWRRERVRFHFAVLERFREVHRQRAEERQHLDDRFHEPNHIGCHRAGSSSAPVSQQHPYNSAWSAYDSNHGSARLGKVKQTPPGVPATVGSALAPRVAITEPTRPASSGGAFSFRRHGTCLCSAVRGPLPLPLALIQALPPWGPGSIEHDDLAPLRQGFFSRAGP
jgi:hypothetical protein